MGVPVNTSMGINNRTTITCFPSKHARYQGETPSLRLVRMLTKAADDRWMVGWKLAGLLALLLLASLVRPW